MLAYDTQAATPIDSERLELISRPAFRRNPTLGFIDPVTISTALGGGGASPSQFLSTIKDFFGGLFSKDPDKSAFDSERQRIWDQFANLVDTVDGLSANSQLSASLLRQYIGALQTLMENYYEYYQRMRSVAGAAWTDPRFHDFYDPMQVKLADWQYIIQSAMLPESIAAQPTLDPETGRLLYAPTSPGLMAGLSGNLPLILLGVGALFLFSRSSRKG